MGDAKAIGGAISSVLDADKAVTAFGKGLLQGPGSTRLGTRRLLQAPWPSSTSPVPYTGEPGVNSTYVPATSTRTPGAARLDGGRCLAAPSFPAPQVTDTMTHNTGVGGDQGPLSVNVNRTVQGEAKLTVMPGSELVRIAEQAKQATIELRGMIRSGNGVGTTGRSSPDAAAPSHVGSAGNSPL